MANNVEHPFMCLLSIHISSLMKFLVFAPKIAFFLGGCNIQDSCLENFMDREAWRATIHGVVKSRTRLTHTQNTFIYLVMPTQLAGSQFPNQGSDPGCGSDSAES